ncbi:hypothetical protein ACQJBY_058544 [Aegilops geniculata]
MSTTSTCVFCGARDSWRHALLECAMASSVWALSDDSLVEHMSQHDAENAREWIFAMKDALSHERFVRMTVTLWAVWAARRKAIYEDIFQSPHATHTFINSFLSDLQVIKNVTNTVVQARAARPTHWLQPPLGTSKINVDATCMKSSSVGAVAAVCRSREGIFLGASTVVFKGISDPTTLEAMGVRESMALVEDLQLQAIHVATDCMDVVKDIKQKSNPIYGAIIHEIIEYSSSFNSCTFVHEFRSSNVEAHNLAKHALGLEFGRHVWLGHPGDLTFVPVTV